MENASDQDSVELSLPTWHRELLQQADQELPELEAAFTDFLNRIRTEKPDVLIFLDKSARVFGMSFLKYLKRLERTGKIKKAPEVRFYNDHDLKDIYGNWRIFRADDPYFEDLRRER